MGLFRYIIVLLCFPLVLSAQNQEHCANHIILNLISVNFQSGCDFTDFGGIDAAITIFDLNGNILINNEVEDLGQVSGPAQNVPFNLSSNPDCCGNGYSQTLGIFPINDVLFDFAVEIYDNDGGCCDGYQTNSDDNYGSQIISLNIIDDVTGTIDVGSCISFNYELDITPIFEYGRMELEDTVCPDFNITLNDIDYNINNPMGFDTVWGASANGCDSFIQVNLAFYDEVNADLLGEPTICVNGTQVLSLSENYAEYEWSTGETSPQILIDMPGFYEVQVASDDGCISSDSLFVEYNTAFFPSIIGNQEFCVGEETTLFVDDQFTDYIWSTGSNEASITVSQPGEYSVTVVNSEGCESETSFEVNEVAVDIPNFNGDFAFCYEEFGTVSLEGVYANYEWSTGDSMSTIQVSEPGTYSVTVSNAIGCSNENSIDVIELDQYIEIDTIFTCVPEMVGEIESVVFSPEGCTGVLYETTILYAPIPDYDIIQYPFIISGTNIELFIEIDSSFENLVSWYGPNEELLCNACMSIVVAPEETTLYEVVVDYHPECQIRETFELNVRSDTRIYVPNIFTPSSEIGNDMFTLYGRDLASIDLMNIYDRWGSLIFEGGGQDAFWDGTKGGLELLSGVYVYYVEVTFKDGTGKALTGDITLLH